MNRTHSWTYSWSGALLAGTLAITPLTHAANTAIVPVVIVPTWDQLVRRPLSLADALNIAASQNAVILAATKEVEARYGVAVQVRAIVLPKVLAETDYVVRQDSLIEQNQHREKPKIKLTIPALGIDLMLGGGNQPRINNQMWIADVRIVQSLYEGGRMLSALRQTKLIREQALLDFETVVSDVLLNVRVAYDDAQLAALQIQLRTQSVNLLGEILEKIRIQRKVGMVTEFEELRAKVEQENARTSLALAGPDFTIAKQRLVQLLGYDVPVTAPNNLPLDLATPLRAHKYDATLPNALVTAQLLRPELASIHVAGKLGDEAIIVAKAGYKPSVQAFVGYDAVSRVMSRNAGDPYLGVLSGVHVSWPIFDGFLTKGRVAEAGARRDQIAYNTEELARQITLEVRSAWEQMVQSRGIVHSQSSNVVSAARSIELAQIRFTTGIGSEVELLSAQTALTDARDNYATALHTYSVAYSRLLRATGEDLQRAPAGK